MDKSFSETLPHSFDLRHPIYEIDEHQRYYEKKDTYQTNLRRQLLVNLDCYSVTYLWKLIIYE